MTAPTGTRPDEDFEAQVRAMLARRATDVADDGVGDALPTGLRIPIDDRPPASRTRWLAVAAAIVFLLGVVGLVARAGGGDAARERTGPAAEPTTSDRARPAHLETLPAGVDPTVGPVLGVAPAAATPEQAMAEVLEPTFGDDLTSPMPFLTERGEDPDLWASWYIPTLPVDAGAWGTTDRQSTGGGSVTARRGPDGWQVVAVTSDAIDLSRVRYAGGRLSGTVDAPPKVSLVIEILALDRAAADGIPLARTDLTTDAPPGRRTTFSLDQMEPSTPFDGPVVLRVEALDRPGNVGTPGARVAALATVVLPGGELADGAEVAPTAPPTEAEVASTGAEPTTASTTAPVPSTIAEPDGVTPNEGTVVTGIAVDAPVVAAIGAALPTGEEVVAAQVTSFAARPEAANLTVSTVVDGTGFEVTVFRAFDASELDGLEVEVPWGQAWSAAVDPDLTSVYAQSTAGVAVRVANLDPAGPPASVEELLAIAETLVSDPAVAAVANGADPAG